MNHNKSDNIILAAKALSKHVMTSEGRLHILSAVSFEIKPGETVAITGASGSGKSTLLGLLAGLDVPSSGEVILAGKSIGGLDEDARAILRAEYIGFIFQSFHLLPALTALENVMLPLELAGISNAETQARDMLQRVRLQQRSSHYPNQLSGGEQQRVAIARAFADQPPVLLADEPTGNLDSATGVSVMDLLFELNKDKGATLVLVTHNAQLAARCRRRLTLEAGRLIGDAG